MTQEWRASAHEHAALGATLRARLSRHRLRHAWDLLGELLSRDLKHRYKRSVLGIGWSLLNPFLQLMIFTLVFSHILPLHIPHYPTFVFSGLLAWTWFSNAMLGAPMAIVDNPELVRRPGFPVAALPVLTVASNAIPFLLALPILFLFIAVDKGTFGPPLMVLPLIIGLQFLLTLGLSGLVSATNVRFRDTQHLVGLLLMFGFYLTPVFYSASAIPGKYALIYQLNPMALLLQAYRAVLIQAQWPDFRSLLFVAAVAAVTLAVGYYAFDRSRARFAEEL